MTIVEALASSRPFRRQVWPLSLGYMTEDKFRTFEWVSQLNRSYAPEVVLTPADVRATDWEIENTPIKNESKESK